MKEKTLRDSSIAVGAVLLLFGCGLEPADNSEDLDVVVTAPAQGADFRQVTTYALPTEVPLIKQSDVEAEPVEAKLDATLQAAILDTVNQNMSRLGYRRVENPEQGKPDVFLEVSAIATQSLDVYYSSWSTYWGSYYAPWYGTYYGAGWAPVVTPYVVESSFGTVLINMTNPNAPDPASQKIPTLWVAAVNGVLNDAIVPGGGTARVVDGINQAFAQSPYLTR